MMQLRTAKVFLSGAGVAICMAGGFALRSQSAEKPGQNPADICRELTVAIEVGPNGGPDDFLYLDDLQRAALVRLKKDFGYSYSNTWKLGVVIKSPSPSNAVVCTMKYHFQKGNPEYNVSFDRGGKIVGCQQIIATFGTSIDEAIPDWKERLNRTNKSKAVSDK